MEVVVQGGIKIDEAAQINNFVRFWLHESRIQIKILSVCQLETVRLSVLRPQSIIVLVATKETKPQQLSPLFPDLHS